MEILAYILETRVIFIPVLIILGFIVKNLQFIPDKFIPLILLVFGILFSVLSDTGAIIDGVVQGVLVTGAAVLGNQIPKQLKKDE